VKILGGNNMLRITIQDIGPADLDSLEITVRLHGRLKLLGIKNLNDLRQYSIEELRVMSVPGKNRKLFPRKTFKELEDLMKLYGLILVDGLKVIIVEL
jgi:hypothetical protein